MSFLFFGSALGSEKDSLLRSEIRIQVDNDAFLFRAVDQYYSSGIMANYRWIDNAGKKTSAWASRWKRYEKTIWSLGMRHRMYTPKTLKTVYQPLIDRPYAGWVELKGGVDYLFENSKISSELYLGWLGPGSKSAEIHQYWHEMLNFEQPTGWETYQVRDQPTVQLKIDLSKKVVGNQNLELIAESSADLGTIHQFLTVGGFTRLGYAQPIGQSAYSGGNMGLARKKLNQIHADDRTRDFYFFFRLSYTKVYRNITVEGELVGDVPDFKGQLNDNILKREIGFQRGGYYFDWSISYVWMSSEMALNDGHEYVTISLSHRL